MNAITFGVTATGLYLISALFQWLSLVGKRKVGRQTIITLGLAGAVAHCISTYLLMSPQQGVDLSFFNSAAIIGLIVTLIVIFSSLKKPLENLFIGLFPLAALTILAATLFPSQNGRPFSTVLVTHILLSIFAYSLLTIAAFQAVMLFAQNHQLKHKHTVGIIKALPPLQTMERLLFEIIWVGMILLTASILTGFIFIDDMLQQQLIHKTFFSILAWLVFGTLLWGRYQLGWRGMTAVRWTLSGCATLMIGYFGTKLVLEMLI